MEKDNDLVLVEEFLNGNEEAFKRIAKKYQQRIYWHARRIVLDHYDADEITQEVLLLIYNKLNTFKFNSSLYTWIYRITSNRSINFLRKKNLKRFISIESAEADEYGKIDNIAADFENREKLEELESVLAKLPPKQREIFALRHFEGLSYDEISKITHRSIGSIKANYFHALKKVTELVKNE
jgi:RNA polymerase sigma-70 factor (ECF subfamily)